MVSYIIHIRPLLLVSTESGISRCRGWTVNTHTHKILYLRLIIKYYQLLNGKSVHK